MMYKLHKRIQLSNKNYQKKLGMDLNPRYSTRDHWIQESIKRIFNSGLFWAVRAAEKKNKQPAISMLLLRSVFYVFIAKKNLNFFKNIVASALKSYIAKVTKN